MSCKFRWIAKLTINGEIVESKDETVVGSIQCADAMREWCISQIETFPGKWEIENGCMNRFEDDDEHFFTGERLYSDTGDDETEISIEAHWNWA